MEISEKTGNYIQGGTAAGLGFLTWVKTATAKYEAGYPPGYSITAKSRIEDTLSLMVGNSVVKSLDPAYLGGGPAVMPNPAGAINSSTFMGAGILIADYILRKSVPNKYYKNLPIIPDVIRGAGIGITVGGVIGGMWDPAPTQEMISAAWQRTAPRTNGIVNSSMGAIAYTVS